MTEKPVTTEPTPACTNTATDKPATELSRGLIEAKIAEYERGLTTMRANIGAMEQRLARERNDYIATDGAVKALRDLLRS